MTAVLVIALAAGCTTRPGARLGTIAGFGLIGVGLILTSPTIGDSGGETYQGIAPIPLTVGALLVGISLYVYFTAKSDDEAPTTTAPPAPPVNKHAEAREHAWALTKQAMAAGRADDCATVLRLDGEVRALDAEFYADVFARDRGIARCLPRP